MAKKAVSLTLDEANLVWLKGQGYGRGNLSAAVDDLITEARLGRLGKRAAPRSVVGSVDIAVDDAKLERADAAIRELFAMSLSRPGRVQEASPAYGDMPPVKRSRRRG